MYESFYNLSAGPFQLTPDPRFLYPSLGHKRALAYLMYGMQRREGFVVITGDIGIGKTLLVQKLIDDIGGRNLSVARVAMANLDADGVVPMVASAFGLPPESRSKAGLLNDLVTKIQPLHNHGALLIVDEAQTCTPAALEELRLISNLQNRGKALLQVFLIGQSELRGTLAQPGMEQLRQRIITSYHLRPLVVEELRDYIQHRLAAAGWQGDPALAEAIYPRIHWWTNGIPRRINLLMDRLLLYGYLEELHALDEADVQIVINELEAEQEDEFGHLQPPPAPAAIPSEESEALLTRIDELEKAFTAAVGETRAKQLLDKHETSAQQRALVEMNMRLARLESLLADQGAIQALHEKAPAPGDASAADEARAAADNNDPHTPHTRQPETQQSESPGNADPVSPTPASDTQPDRVANDTPAPRPTPTYYNDLSSARQPLSGLEQPAGTPKWRLFSRRK